jgi:hypothetical protein
VEKVWSQFRIGEKIGLGFAVVGLLFAGVVWHYHQTLQSVLGDYQQLQSVFEVRKSLALEIEIEMAAARDAEKDFLIQRRSTSPTRSISICSSCAPRWQHWRLWINTPGRRPNK